MQLAKAIDNAYIELLENGITPQTVGDAIKSAYIQGMRDGAAKARSRDKRDHMIRLQEETINVLENRLMRLNAARGLK